MDEDGKVFEVIYSKIFNLECSILKYLMWKDFYRDLLCVKCHETALRHFYKKKQKKPGKYP